VLAHHLADCHGGFGSVIEGDRGYEVVADVRANDAVEEMRVDEAQVAVDGGSGAAREGPRIVVVVRKRAISVLEEGNRNY
jgi:hypothetical protein